RSAVSTKIRHGTCLTWTTLNVSPGATRLDVIVFHALGVARARRAARAIARSLRPVPPCAAVPPVGPAGGAPASAAERLACGVATAPSRASEPARARTRSERAGFMSVHPIEWTGDPRPFPASRADRDRPRPVAGVRAERGRKPADLAEHERPARVPFGPKRFRRRVRHQPRPDPAHQPHRQPERGRDGPRVVAGRDPDRVLAPRNAG